MSFKLVEYALPDTVCIK